MIDQEQGMVTYVEDLKTLMKVIWEGLVIEGCIKVSSNTRIGYLYHPDNREHDIQNCIKFKEEVQKMMTLRGLKDNVQQ